MSCTCPQFDCMEHGAQAKNLMTQAATGQEISASRYIVVGADGSIACRPGAFTTGTWAKVPTDQKPPDYLLNWEAWTGAQRFANMNGGKVTTVLEHFYAGQR